MATKKEIEDAYHLIHDNLSFIPEEYCCWKETVNGASRTKTLGGYRYYFLFIRNIELRNNLAELRMCFDYHYSLYKLHKPGLTFGWQHKLVLCQLLAGIYEGILYDLFEHLTDPKQKSSIANILAKQKMDNKGFGFGSLIDIFSQINSFPKSWNEYLTDLKYLRDTIHPKSLNDSKASYKTNKVVQKSPDQLLKDLDIFVESIKKKY